MKKFGKLSDLITFDSLILVMSYGLKWFELNLNFQEFIETLELLP